HVFKDWKRGGHGVLDMYHALVHSCDVYFYNVGHRLGIDTIAETARLFGLGQPTGVDLPSERAGVVPSTEWKQRVRKEQWYPGETGTAQTVGARASQVSTDEEGIPEQLRDHAWFVAYAPAEDPKIAVAVLVENTGHGGTYAAPIAKALIEEYWKDSDVDDRHQI